MGVIPERDFIPKYLKMVGSYKPSNGFCAEMFFASILFQYYRMMSCPTAVFS
jgi:hypothetical protein